MPLLQALDKIIMNGSSNKNTPQVDGGEIGKIWAFMNEIRDKHVNPFIETLSENAKTQFDNNLKPNGGKSPQKTKCNQMSTLAELRQAASKAKIHGRSKMSKNELVKALTTKNR